MERKDYANIKNWKGTATRIISLDEIQDFEIGEKRNFGLSWTDGGEFTVENQKEYNYLIVIEEECEGHEVDYDNEEECYDLGCEDCSFEKEIIIDREFEIIQFFQHDEETGFGKIIVK